MRQRRRLRYTGVGRDCGLGISLSTPLFSSWIALEPGLQLVPEPWGNKPVKVATNTILTLLEQDIPADYEAWNQE